MIESPHLMLSRFFRSPFTSSSPSIRRFSVSVSVNMKIVPVPVRQDNYAYLLIDDATNKAAVVDPFDVPKVKSAAEKLGVELVALLTTHHHADHSGGNQDFASLFPTAPIYGGSDRIPALTKLIKDKDEFTIGDSITVKCLATPCHTQDSICYYATDKSSPQGGVFTGDTLFIAGCGRFFEGDGAQMHAALSYLGSLPDHTLVYTGHEYTADNLAFARAVDPNNKALNDLKALIDEEKITQGRSSLKNEKEWNVFMRLDSDAVRKVTKKTIEADIMDTLRDQKNNFKG